MRTLIRLLLLALVAVASWSLLDAERRTPRGRRPSRGGGGEPGPSEERRCEAVTQSGERCRRPVEPGSDYCWQHGG